MSVAPLPANYNPSVGYPTAFGRQAVPAHKIIAKNGQNVVGSGEPDTADKAPVTAAADKPFSFWDLVDIINPLQHIPIVSTIYRNITGDEIGDVARVAGGALYGGIIGAALGGLNAVLADNTGKDLGDTVVSMFTSDDAKPDVDAATDMADADETDRPVVVTNNNALFDQPAGQTAPDTVAPEPPAVPVIEVRPQASADSVLPAAKNVTALNDVEKNAPLAPKKANVQQAMMQALLKMQSGQADALANDKKDDDNSVTSADGNS